MILQRYQWREPDPFLSSQCPKAVPAKKEGRVSFQASHNILPTRMLEKSPVVAPKQHLSCLQNQSSPSIGHPSKTAWLRHGKSGSAILGSGGIHEHAPLVDHHRRSSVFIDTEKTVRRYHQCQPFRSLASPMLTAIASWSGSGRTSQHPCAWASVFKNEGRSSCESSSHFDINFERRNG